MNDEQIKKVIDGTYDEPREDGICSGCGTFRAASNSTDPGPIAGSVPV